MSSKRFSTKLFYLFLHEIGFMEQVVEGNYKYDIDFSLKIVINSYRSVSKEAVLKSSRKCSNIEIYDIETSNDTGRNSISLQKS